MPEIILILRFRDLAKPTPGYTIKAHRDVITRDGYVWWAWWKKQSEDVPLSLWDRVKKQIMSSGPAQVYLLDSGQRRLYKAQLADIRAELGGALAAAPEDGAKTPAYYSEESFATWFKLSAIDDAAEADLRSLAFLEPPHDDIVSFDRRLFTNSRIEGIPQLLQFGNITYWVATPATASTRDVVNAPVHSRIPPPVAPADILRATNNRILHISDIHVSSREHAFARGKGDAHNLSMAAALFQSLGQQHAPGLVIVSGDLTSTGSAEEFDEAFEVLDDVRATLGLNRSDFIIVPGNHDIQWTVEAAGAPAPAHGYPIVVEAAKCNYAEFFRRWYNVESLPTLALGRRFFLHGGPTLDVVGVNSSELQQFSESFAGIGRVTAAALESAIGPLGWGQDRATERRILVTHHHVLPVISVEKAEDAAQGFGIAIDAEAQLDSAAQHRVDLILHGHQHQPFAGQVSRQRVVGDSLPTDHGILVLGCGSTGVIDAHLGPIGQRMFNLLTLGPNDVRVEVYGTPHDRTTFARVAVLTAPYSGRWTQEKV